MWPLLGFGPSGLGDIGNGNLGDLNRDDPLAEGLVAAWLFTEGAGGQVADSVSGRFPGTLTNGPTWGSGPYGRHLTFDGTDDRVAFAAPGGTPLDLSGTNQITLSATVRIASFQASFPNIRQIVGDESGSSPQCTYWLRVGSPSASNQVQFNVRVGGTEQSLANGSALSLNRWYRFDGTYDGVTQALYIDGVLVASKSTTGTFGTAGTGFSIGASTDVGRFFHGDIASVEVRRRALAATQVAALAADPYRPWRPTRVSALVTGFGGSGVAYTPPKVYALDQKSNAFPSGGQGNLDLADAIEWGHPLARGLVGFWLPGADGAGGRLTDLVNGRHGTLTNGPTWGAGQFGPHVTFDGTNDRVDLPVPAAAVSGGFTVAVLARSPQASGMRPGAINQVLFGYGGANANFGVNWTHSSPSYQGAFSMIGGGSYPVATWTRKPAAGEWVLVTGTWDGATIRAYLDGTAQGSAANATFGSTSDPVLRLGTGIVGSQEWPGDIAFAAVWGRALPQVQVGALWEQLLAQFPELIRRTRPWSFGVTTVPTMGAAPATQALPSGGQGNLDLANAVEWGHPLAENLVRLWLPVDGAGGRVTEVVRGDHATLVSGPTWTADGVSVSGTGPYVSAVLPFSGSISGVQYSLPFALTWSVRRIAFPTGFNALLDSSESQFKTEYSSTGTFQQGFNFGTLVPGRDYQFTLAYNPGPSNTPGTASCYTNGVLQSVRNEGYFWFGTREVRLGWKFGTSFGGVGGVYGDVQYRLSRAVGIPAVDAARASQIYDQWSRGYPDFLRRTNFVPVQVIATGGGDVTVSLAGAQVATQTGTVTVGSGTAVTLVGSQVAAQAGSVAPTVSLGLAGSQVAAQAGNLTGAVASPLVGTQAATQAGSLGDAIAQALVGTAASAGAGTLVPAVSVLLSGSQVASQAGTITVSSGGGTALTGSQVSTQTGVITPAISLGLAGSQVAAQAGTVTATAGMAVSLTGSQVSTQTGALTSAISLGLAGSQVAAQAGTVTATAGMAVSLTGSQVAAQAGALRSNVAATPSASAVSGLSGALFSTLSRPLIGSSITIQSGTLTQRVIFGLNGAVAAFQVGAPLPNLERALSGSQTVTQAGTVIPSGGMGRGGTFPPVFLSVPTSDGPAFSSVATSPGPTFL